MMNPKKHRQYNRWRYKEMKKDSWSTSRKTKYKMWTKQDIKKVMTLWDETSPQDLCETLNRNKGQILYIARIIRKEGFPLSRRQPRKINILVKDAVKEFNKVKK